MPRKKMTPKSAPRPKVVTPVGELCDYEKERNARIERNEAYMRSLGLGGGLAAVGGGGGPRKASTRGVSRKRKHARPADFEPRRSPRVAGLDAAAAATPNATPAPVAVDWKSRPRNVEPLALLADADSDDDETAAAATARCAEAVGGGATAGATSEIAAYEASVRSLRLAEADVAKVTKDRTFSLAWRPTSDRLVIAAGDRSGRVGLWDVDEEDGLKCCWSFSEGLNRPVTALHWDGDALYAGGYDSLIRRLDFSALASTVVADYETADCGDLTHYAVDADVIWGAHNDGALTRIDARAPAKVAVIEAHGKKVAHVAVRPRSTHVATSSNDGTCVLWDARMLNKKRPKALWSVSHAKSIHGFAFSADGADMCTVSYDDTVGFFAVGGDAGGVRVRHNNHTGRYLTPFKPVFDPHAPRPVAVLGSMGRPRSVDFLDATGFKHAAHDGDTTFHAVTSLHAVHPAHHVVAGANNSGRVSVWRA